mgnify:CR=1 FL=1
MPTSQYNTNGRIVERVGLRLQVERVELRLHARAKLHEESGTRARETKLPLPNLTLMVLAYSGTCLFGQSKHHSHRGYLLGRVKPEFCLTGTTRPFGAGYFVVYTFDTPTHEHAPTHQHAPPTPQPISSSLEETRATININRAHLLLVAPGTLIKTHLTIININCAHLPLVVLGTFIVNH